MHIDDWKIFKIGKIFTCSTTKALNTNEITSGETAYITRTTYKNGCSRLVCKIEEKKVDGNCITIGAEGAVAFYQREEFMPGVKVYTLRNENLNENNALFICTMLNKNCYKYSYNRARILSLIEEETILLPQNGGQPDWNRMANYIESLKEKVQFQLNKIINISQNDEKTLRNFSGRVNAADFNEWANLSEKQPIGLNLKFWKEYEIGDLFKTYTGGDLIIGDVEDGNIPVISHSTETNGVCAFSSEISGQKLFDCNRTIALADRGTFFATLQKEDFYIGTRVKALEAKCEFISRPMLMFMVTIINNESFRFAYGRNCTEGLNTLKIYLPTLFDSEGCVIYDKEKKFSKNGYIPDWKFMELYIKSLPYSKRI